MLDNGKTFNKKIMIAVDESDNACRAVSYVGRLLEGAKDFKVSILHVIRQPEEDYFTNVAEKEKWVNKYKHNVDVMLKKYRQILVSAGFAPEAVSVRATQRYCPSLAECILAERAET